MSWLAAVPVVGPIAVIAVQFLAQAACLVAQQPPEVVKSICGSLGVP